VQGNNDGNNDKLLSALRMESNAKALAAVLACFRVRFFQSVAFRYITRQLTLLYNYDIAVKQQRTRGVDSS